MAAAWPALSQGILPLEDFAPGWKTSGLPRTFIQKDLFNHIDGGAELFLEFGFEKLLVQSYTDGKAELTLELYEMTEPAAALGIFLMNAGRESPWPEIPVRNSSEDAQIAAVKGRFFLKVNNFESGAVLRPAMAALAKAALAGIADDPTGDVFASLPGQKRISGSERLIRGPVGLQPYFTFGEGDILGLKGKIFGALADYKGDDGSTFTRLIVVYPSSSAAKEVLENLRANLDPYLKITATRPDGFDFVDFQSKRGVVERRSGILDIRFKMGADHSRPPLGKTSQ